MEIIDKLLDVKVLNMPIGKAVLLTSALGIATGLSTTVDRLSGGKIPPVLTQLLVAGGVENINVVKNTLGSDFTELIAITSIASGINQQFQVSNKIVDIINNVLSILPGTQTLNVAPTTEQLPEQPTEQEQNLEGYEMGEFNDQTQQLPNVDDVDLALLSARGFQTA